MKLVSIDIGSSKMKFIVGSAGKKHISVKKIFSVQTPADAVNNGEIVDIKLMREALTVAVQNNRLAGRKCVVTIQSSMFISREFIIPRLKKADVESALRFEVEQYMPVALDEYVLSFRELGEVTEDDVKKVRYLVGLMPSRIVSSYHSLLKSSGLKPVFMDVNSNAIEKFMNFGAPYFTKRYKQHEVTLVAEIGNEAMDMTIFEKGCPQINRTVPIGGSEITRSVASTFGIEYGEAEQKKIHRADMMALEINMEYEDLGLNDVAKSVVADWIEQLRRMIEFYMSRTKGKSVDCVFLYGGSSSLKRLDEYLSSVFGIAVHVLTLPSNVRIKKTNALTPNFYNAIGAIIRK